MSEGLRLPPWLTPRVALAGAMVASAVLLLWLSRGQGFFADEWAFFANYRGHSPNQLLEPSSGNLLVAPAILYKGVIALFGAESYLPFRLIWVALALLSARLFFELARRRIGDWAALAPTVLLLFFGAAFEVMGGPLGITVLLTVSCGLGALLLLERDDTVGDMAASGLLLVALASYTPALAFAAGAAVEILVVRRRRDLRSLWVVLVPVALYAAWRIWAIQFHQTDVGLSDILSLPSSMFASLAAACAAITGTFRDPGEEGLSFDPVVGRSLAVVLLAGLVARYLLRHRWPIDRRIWVFVAMLVVFWGLIGANLGPFRVPEASRYQYTGAVLVLLLAVQLGAGLRLSRRGAIALVAITALGLLGNLANLRAGTGFLRENAAENRAQLAALELVSPAANPDLTVEPLVGGPGPREDLLIFTHAYLSAASDLGSPADSPEEILARPEEVRERADLQMVRALGPRPIPPELVPPDAATGVRPMQEGSEAAAVRPAGPCLRVVPQLADAKATFAISPGGFSIRATAGPAPKLKLRRFGDAFVAEIPDPPTGSRSVVRIPPDAAPIPWHVELTIGVPVDVCAP